MLLEREAQLTALAEYAEEAAGGHGRLVLLAGEAGIGKSALLDAFERRAPTLRVARGACDGLFTPRPLGPLYDVAASLDDRVRDALAHDRPRAEIFELLVQVVGTTPTALLLDDVHWADEATLDLIRYLARRLRDLPALLVVSYRDDALVPTDPLRIVLGELATLRCTRRIHPAPLSRSAIETLARSVALSPTEVLRLTGGNPFFVTELLRNGAAGGSVPPSARDAVLARVAQLGESGRRTAEAAALLGGRLDLPLIERVAGACDRDLDELVVHGLLVSEPNGLRFRHELTRQAIAEQVPAHRAAVIHAAALEALTERGADDARLAYHAEGAGDAQGVQWFAPRAAAQAAGLGAHREAVAQLERALRFSDGLDDGEIAALWTERGVECGLVDRWQESADALAEALSRWRKVGDELRVGDTLRHLATAHWRLCLADAGDLAREAVTVLAPLGRTTELAWALARSAVFAPSPRELAEAALAAHELAAELGLPDVRSDALNTRAVALATLGEPWEPVMQEALRLAQESGSDAQAGRAFANYQVMLGQEARWEEHDRLTEEALLYCEEHDIATYGYCLRAGMGDALLQRARWDEARSCSQALVDLEASPVNIVSPLCVVGLAKARCGDASGLEDLDRAVGLADQTDDAEWILLARVPRAEARFLLGDAAAAAADLEACSAFPLADLSREYVGPYVLWSRRVTGRVPEGAAVSEEVRLVLGGQVREAAARWDRRGMSYDAAWALADSDDTDDLRQAVVTFERLGATAAARHVRRLLRDRGAPGIPHGARASTRANPGGLTGREREVLALVARGMTDEQIAAELVLSVRTVHHHVSAVLGKLHVATRREAASYALDTDLLGLLDLTTGR